MKRRIAPLLSALLLLTVACDDPKKDDAKKPDAKVADAKKGADAKVADAKKADAKVDDAKQADAKADTKADDTKADVAKSPEDLAKEAKEAEERKAEIAKELVELETWKVAEKARWTPAIEAELAKLIAADYKDGVVAVKAVLASKHRVPENVERDGQRHPAETLALMGLRPDMTVIEVGPGEGWYTEILAPVLANKGKLLVTDYDPAGPEDKGTTLYARRFQAFLERSPAAYGKIERLVQQEGATLELGPDASADMVLVFRGLHGWVNRGTWDANVKEIHAVLKPGGVFAIEQHRAKDDAVAEETSKQGYLPQPWVVSKLEAAGFTLEEASEVNANPKDTKDHPEGVWTLPPSLELGDKDRDKYTAIGESDRMTLRLRKK
jgi:predicted methyltransferase